MTRLVVDGDVDRSRSGIGLMTVPVTQPVTPTIEMAADLLEAEVTTVLPYAIEIGNGLTETVQLVQTAVYRQGPNRWLLSPPDAAYWGDTRRIEGQYVNLFYPERDKDIAQALLLSLDAKIGQLCAQLPDVDCPNEYKVVVELTTDPGALARLSLIPAVTDAERRHLILPTPTLVGLPQDQTGEQALFRGYGQLVVGAVLTDLWDYDCCEQTSALYFSLLGDALRRLGLRPWPGEVGGGLPVLDYDLLLEEVLPLLFNNASFWYETADEGVLVMPETRADILIAFAQEELGLTAKELAASLNTAMFSQTFGDWLHTMSHTNLSTKELENAWIGFVYDNSSLGQQELPAPLPEQDIELLCHIGGEERMAFYRYNLADGSTQLEQPLNREVNVMVALPDDDGLAVWEAGFNDELTSMFLWRDGRKTAVSWDATNDAPGPVPLRADPSGTKLLLAPAEDGRVNYGLLDVAGCLDSDCQLDTLEGYPTWSPDLAHMILLKTGDFRAHMARARGELVLTDGLGEEIEIIGAGASPFWLDNDRYGYVLDAGEGRRNTVLSGKVGEAGLNDILLTVADLTRDTEDSSLRLLDFVAVHPEMPDHLIIVTMDLESDEELFEWWKGGQPGATLFVYDWEAKETVLMQSFANDVALNRSYRFSPNGRFLLFGEGAEYRPTRLHLLDISTGESKLIATQSKFFDSIEWYTDFSLDGEWLLVVDNGFLQLLYPGSGYERLIIPSTDQCETAVWVNQ